MDKDEFAKAFWGQIRVEFNWPQFFAENWPINAISLSIPTDESRLYVPWYCNLLGEPVGYDAPSAIPMTVAACSSNLKVLEANCVKEFDAATTSPLSLPAYALPHNYFLLLDGAHRVVGAVRSKIALDLVVHAISGPVASHILPDLCHWAQRLSVSDSER